MDFEKIKESCRKIRMPSEMKTRLKEKCSDVDAPRVKKIRQIQPDMRVIIACVCCFLVVLGVGLKYSNIFEKKPSIVSEVTTKTTNTETTLLDLLNSTESAVIQIVETVVASDIHEETTITETQISTVQPIISQVETDLTEYIDWQDVQGVPPHTLYMEDLDKLKRAKAAAKTMSKEDYDAFLYENDYMDIESCFYSPEEYLKFTESDLYVPIVDEGTAEILWMHYVPDYGNIDVGISFDEKNAFRFYINVSGKRESYFKDSYMFRYKKTIQRENITADVFKTKLIYREDWAWEGLAIDLVVDGQEIAARTSTKMRDSDFEKYFDQIKFVKIKDWI